MKKNLVIDDDIVENKTLYKKVNDIQKERENEMVHDELGYFFKLGLSLLTQRRRQDLPVLCKRPLDRMELQSLGPHFFTWFNRTSSSSAFHGPFLIPSSLLPSIQNSFSFLRHKRSYICHFLCKSFSISYAALSVIFLSSV